MAEPKVPARTPSYDKKVGLVLQDGGALGSYQAGVYEGLSTSHYLPDWVAGISIGAINAAIIAGNAPEKRVDRLSEFWEGITALSQPNLLASQSSRTLRSNDWAGARSGMPASKPVKAADRKKLG